MFGMRQQKAPPSDIATDLFDIRGKTSLGSYVSLVCPCIPISENTSNDEVTTRPHRLPFLYGCAVCQTLLSLINVLMGVRSRRMQEESVKLLAAESPWYEGLAPVIQIQPEIMTERGAEI